MAINIKFDLIGNPEPPTIILANRNGNKLGQLKVNTDSIEIINKLDVPEFSFTINKYIDGKLTHLWDKVLDFKLVYCKEWDTWFEIKVELDEETETVKTVYCTQLGQAELSQIMLYNIEINTEKDIERDDYKISILWDENNPKNSILGRTLEKAPHYRIAYVDPTIAKIQRSFSFDGNSIHDAHQEIAEEIGCLFVYPSNSNDANNETDLDDEMLKSSDNYLLQSFDDLDLISSDSDDLYDIISSNKSYINNKIQRTVFVYDLQQNCNNCGHRGEFTDKCPKCGSTNIKYGYGEDTLIFVTSDELASEGIQLVTDTESVKNCFKLEAGDDLMTATVRNCNPNGTDYIWYFSDAVKEDMSDELVEKIESYSETYNTYYNDYKSDLDAKLLSDYNSLVNKYSVYNKNLQTIVTPITGYSKLMNAFYNIIDLALYLESGLMPSIEMSDTNATEQASLLTSSSLSPVAVNTDNISSVSLSTANSAVLSMAKIVVKSTYKVEVGTSTLSNDNVWRGNFIITNYSDEEDTATSGAVEVVVNNNVESFIKQKIDKALNKDNTDDYSISGLFKKEHDDFCAELKKYALNPLKSFYDACDACLNILIDQGAGNKNEKPDLYAKLYEPYYAKSSAISNEIKIRENEIAIVKGVWDKTDEESQNLITKGLQQYIEECKNNIKKALDFEKYLGEELWLEFCAYRREDTYSNDNYISDGLNNAELFKRAQEFYEVAENEIYKSAELQHSISTTLNNLLAIDKFKPLANSFNVGNWIRVRVDDEIFKLRLLEYTIDFGNFNNIPVEFSDVTKIKNGITDVESILSQASSMTSSYDHVQKQASKGNEAQGTIDTWLANGLNSAMVQIQNNDNEDLVFDRNGLLCRSYDDITGTYLPEQFRLTHNIMAYTTDNWETVSAALGKHEYTKWENNQWIKDIDYGLTSKFVTAGYVTGSQIIGGEIVSSNYQKGVNGTYFNLIDGDFDIAGGSIVYDSNDKALTLKNVTIEWSSSNKPEINDISGLDEYLDKLDEIEGQIYDANLDISTLDSYVAKYLGLGGNTIIGSSYVISPIIEGGYLNITNIDNNSRVIIDPNNLTGNDYIFQVHNGNQITLGIDKDGNALFNGTIYADDGRFSGTISGSIIEGGTININDKFIVDEQGAVTINGNDDYSSINFGDAFAVSNKGLTADSGTFNSLKVGGEDVMTMGNLGCKIVVSVSEPNEREVLWFKPSSISTIEYSGSTPSIRNESAYLGNSNDAKSFIVNCTADAEDAIFSGDSTFKYKIKFPIILAGNTDNQNNVGFEVVATKSDDSNKKVTFPMYTIATIEPWKWYYIEITAESTVNLCETKSDINLSIKSNNAVNNGYLYIQKDNTIYFTCSDTNSSGGIQTCSVHYIP